MGRVNYMTKQESTGMSLKVNFECYFLSCTRVESLIPVTIGGFVRETEVHHSVQYR